MPDWYENNEESIRKLKKIPIQYVIPGMVTARDVLTITNQLILPKDRAMSDRIIQKAKDFGIDYVYIYEEESLQNISLEYLEKIKNSKVFREFSDRYSKSLVFVKDTLIRLTNKDESIDVERIINEVGSIIQSTSNNIAVFQMIDCIEKFDDDTFIHSLNVSIMCDVFANWLGLSEQDKNVLILGGVFHDIGKLLIPKAILRKTGKLSDVEFNMIKLHTVRGYGFVKNKNLPIKVKNIILNHHERYDGSGYPNQKSGEKIDDFSTIIAIADVFEAMTSKRVYRDSKCPFEVIRFFEEEGYAKFNPKVIVPLLEKMAEIYIGHNVRLNDGREAEVVKLNANSLSKPMIRLKNDEFLDLSNESGLEITDVL